MDLLGRAARCVPAHATARAGLLVVLELLAAPLRRPAGVRAPGTRASKSFLTAVPISFLRDDLGALLLALVDHLDLAGDRRQRRRQVAEARRDLLLAVDAGRAARGSRRGSRSRRSACAPRRPRTGRRTPRPRAAKAISSTSSRKRSGTSIFGAAVALEPGLLRRDLRRGLHVLGVVREDLRGDAVLQRRDDVAAVGVVLGVGREDEQDVERDADREAADLEVALLEDVQQADLDARLEVRAAR